MGPTTIAPKKLRLLEAIAGRKSKKVREGPPTAKEQYKKTLKALKGRLKEAKKVRAYKALLEGHEADAKSHAKHDRYEDALASLAKMDVLITRALEPEIAERAEELTRDLAAVEEQATQETIKLKPPDDRDALLANIKALIEKNNLDGAERLLTRLKDGAEAVRKELKQVKAERDAYGTPPGSLKAEYDAIGTALDDGDAEAARAAVDAYGEALQKKGDELSKALESLGPPPFDLKAAHEKVVADLEGEDFGAAETDLAAYQKDFEVFQTELIDLRRDLLAKGAAPAGLADKYNEIAAALDKGALGGVREKLEDYAKDLEKLNSLRAELGALGKPPKSFKDQFEAAGKLIEQGAVAEAGAAVAECRKAVAALTALNDEFLGLGFLPLDLAEQHMKITNLLDEGKAEEARKALDAYKKDHEATLKEMEALRGEALALPTPMAKDLAQALQALLKQIQRGSLEEARKALVVYKAAVGSQKEDADKIRADLQKQLEEMKKKLPPGVEELPTDLADAHAAVLKRIEEGSLTAAKAGLEALLKTLEDTAKPDRFTKRRAKVGERLENARTSPTIGAKIKAGLEAADDLAGKKDFLGALAHLDKTIKLLAKHLKEMTGGKDGYDALADRGFAVEAFMTSPTNGWHSDGTKTLPKRKEADWLKKAEKHRDDFQADVEQAERKYQAQAPRDPTDLGNLQAVRDRYARGVTGHPYPSDFARNTEQARSIATRVITRDGQVDFGYLAMLPFGGDTNVALLRGQVEDSPEGELSQSQHASRMLKRLETDKNLRQAIENVTAPKESAFGPERKADYDRVCNMIRESLGLPKDAVITDVHARQAAVAALLTEIRQVEVGSCFGTSVAIQVQKNKPEMLIKDMQDLFSKGEITRTFKTGGKDVTVKIPLNPDVFKDQLTLGVNFNLHEAPQFITALDTLGVGAGERKDVLDDAQVVVRDRKIAEAALKKLPGSVSAALRKEIIEEAIRRKGTRAVPTLIRVLRDVMKEKGIPAARRNEVGNEYSVVKTADYEATTAELLEQVVRNRATTALTDEEVLAASEPAKIAFDAQRDNRLLRAWEYTVASSAAKSNSYCVSMKRGAQKTALAMLNEVLAQERMGKPLARVNELLDVGTRVNTEVEKLLEETVEYNYDSSIAHTRPSDGQSSTGGWVMYYGGKKIETEKQYKDMLKDVIAKARAVVEKDLQGDPKQAHVATFTDGLTARVDAPGFTARALTDVKDQTPAGDEDDVMQPWSSAGGGNLKQLMDVYFGQDVKLDEPSTQPSSEEDVAEWLLDMTRQMKPKIADGVALDPDNALVPLNNGPHSYSFRPGSPFFKKDLETNWTGTPKTSAEVVANYKDKAKGRRTTAFPLKDPPDGMAKKLIDKMLSPLNGVPHVLNPLRTRLEQKLKALGAAEVTAEQIHTCFEQATDEVITNPDPDIVELKRMLKADCKSHLGKAIQAEIQPPVDVADLDPLLDKVLNKAATHLSVGDRAKVTKTVKDALSAGGATEASMPKIHKAIVDAIKALPVDPKLPPPPPLKEDEVMEALKPEPPPGIVFAETNWGLGNQQTLFSMIPDAFTDALEMWSVEEDGTMGKRQDKAQWVTANWQLATNPDQYGGVAWGESAPSGYESVK